MRCLIKQVVKNIYKPFEIVSAGDHWDLKMSRQIDPLLFMLGWYMRVVKATFGGLNG